MKGIRVDPETRTVRVQAGELLGKLDRETQAFGLAVPAGVVTHTGIAGLTLGGGIGWLMRKHGLTIDQLHSVDLVTANGEFVKASENENADLFWGIKGGGSNFGIVTEFEFRLNPVGPIVLAGPVFWHMTESPNVLRFYPCLANGRVFSSSLLVAGLCPSVGPGLRLEKVRCLLWTVSHASVVPERRQVRVHILWEERC